MNRGVGGEEKSFRWKLPVQNSKRLGKLGPGFGFGAGCGVGAGIGFVGGMGFGVPGLQLGVGLGAGCGIGFGFGYGYGIGMGRGIGDVGNLPSQDEIGAIIDELAINTKKLVQATYRKLEKGKRF